MPDIASRGDTTVIIEDEGLKLRQVLSTTAWAALTHAPQLMVASLLLGATFFLTLFSCGVAIFLWPYVVWGVARFCLNAIEGKGQLRDLVAWRYEPLRAYGQMAMWAIFIVMLSLGPIVFGYGISFSNVIASLQGRPTQPLLDVLSLAISWVIGLFTIRLLIAPFLIVDQRRDAFDAILTSWAVTWKSWPKLMVIPTLQAIALSPAPGVAFIVRTLNHAPVANPRLADLLEGVGWLIWAGNLAYVAAIGWMLQLAVAATYRQLQP